MKFYKVKGLENACYAVREDGEKVALIIFAPEAIAKEIVFANHYIDNEWIVIRNNEEKTVISGFGCKAAAKDYVRDNL